MRREAGWSPGQNLQTDGGEQDTAERRRIPVLCADAGEDHIKLKNEKNTIVPLVSICEGIEKRGKRGACKNMFHISEYDQKIGHFAGRSTQRAGASLG